MFPHHPLFHLPMAKNQMSHSVPACKRAVLKNDYLLRGIFIWHVALVTKMTFEMWTEPLLGNLSLSMRWAPSLHATLPSKRRNRPKDTLARIISQKCQSKLIYMDLYTSSRFITDQPHVSSTDNFWGTTLTRPKTYRPHTVSLRMRKRARPRTKPAWLGPQATFANRKHTDWGKKNSICIWRERHK